MHLLDVHCTLFSILQYKYIMYNRNGERKYNSNVCTFEKALIIISKPISFDT